MNQRLIFWAIIIVLSGLLFWIEVAVMFRAEQEIHKLRNLSDVIHNQSITSTLYGTTDCVLLGGMPAQKFGQTYLEDVSSWQTPSKNEVTEKNITLIK